jgi:beta-lactamase class A
MSRQSLPKLSFFLLSFCQFAWPAEPLLERELARLADVSGGTMGVAVVHLESGRNAFLNADDSFPMASTYKVPIATELLTLVDAGQLTLSKMIDINPQHLSPGSGTISTLLDDPGVSISLHNLLELMLLISDNSATDIILTEVGGGEAVTDRMKALDLAGIRVDRPTLGIIADFLGLEELPPPSARHREGYVEIFEAIPEEIMDAASAKFDGDPRDTATPRDMALLLEKIWRGEILSGASSALLIDIMERCQTGEARLKGILPEDTVVAHKTGTIGNTTNDVGIITLPDDAGHVIVVAFVKESKIDVPERERAIAEAARAAHDYFLFTAD